MRKAGNFGADDIREMVSGLVREIGGMGWGSGRGRRKPPLLCAEGGAVGSDGLREGDGAQHQGLRDFMTGVRSEECTTRGSRLGDVSGWVSFTQIRYDIT